MHPLQLQKKVQNAPHVPLPQIALPLRTSGGKNDDFDEKDPTCRFLALHGRDEIAYDPHGIAARPVVAYVAEEEDIRIFVSGVFLRREKVMRDEADALCQVRRKICAPLLDGVLVVLDDEAEIRVRPGEGDADEAGGAADLYISTSTYQQSCIEQR